MRDELEQKLVAEFPSFFRGYRGDPRVTCMAWGCDHGDGWFDLLRDACLKIKIHCDLRPELSFSFTQIKEKFGQLRIYTSAADETIHHIVRQVEDESADVCEICGSREGAEVRDRRGWLSCRCLNCWEEVIKPTEQL